MWSSIWNQRSTEARGVLMLYQPKVKSVSWTNDDLELSRFSGGSEGSVASKLT